MKQITKKRFIAGAICPTCKQLDTLMWWKVAHMEMQECVKCGYSERRSDASSDGLDDKTKESLIGIFKPQ